MLTKRQADCLEFLERWFSTSRVGPSFDDICANLGLSSRGAAHRLIAGLEERGFIRRLKGRARCVELVRDSRRDDLAEAYRALAWAGGHIVAGTVMDSPHLNTFDRARIWVEVNDAKR